MKKIIFAIAVLAYLAVAVTKSEAQVVSKNLYTTLTSTVDSIRCISTTPNFLYVRDMTQAWHTGAFQVTITRVSAAIGGTITAQGSVDGTNWFNASFNTGDTITVADAASQVKVITVKAKDGYPFRYYRLNFVGASSDTMTVRAKFVGRK